MTRPATIRWEVQHYTLCNGWVNTWFIDDMPETFATRDEAQAELDEFFSDVAHEIACGDRLPDEGYVPDDFRIVPVQKAGGALCQ
ncbi:MAG: hypothetical protein KJ622_13550 [Alphaproteobacteria bacterium]|nr:hypothetical protein [Alphaproteobacteria bacterium]